MRNNDAEDPKGLIAESFEIEGITPGDCRTIFLDWALSLPPDMPQERAVRRLLSRHQGKRPDHPMQAVLREALVPAAPPRRRGGWAARHRDG